MSHTLMTKATAQQIVERAKRQPVNALQLQEAICCLRRGHDRFHLPALPEAVRARANMVLLWNLGRACGKVQ